MAEDPARLHVLGVTGDGELFHTMRRPEGWTPFVNVFETGIPNLDFMRGHVTEVSATRLVRGNSPRPLPMPEGLFVIVGSSLYPNPMTLFRVADTRTWQVELPRPVTDARRVAVATASSNGGDFFLHTSWVRDNGRPVNTSDPLPLKPSGNPALTTELNAGLPPGGSRVVASSGFDLVGVQDSYVALTTVTANGGLWTASVSSSGTRAPWRDVEALTGERGAFRDVAMALERPQGAVFTSHIAGITGEGSAWLTRLSNTGAAGQPWRNLEEVEATIIGVGVVFHTRLVLEFGTFERIALGATSEGLHILVVTTDGRLLHQLDPSPGQEFRDVEAVGLGQDVGSFVAVACA
jgi:hypothetical protein